MALRLIKICREARARSVDLVLSSHAPPVFVRDRFCLVRVLHGGGNEPSRCRYTAFCVDTRDGGVYRNVPKVAVSCG